MTLNQWQTFHERIYYLASTDRASLSEAEVSELRALRNIYKNLASEEWAEDQCTSNNKVEGEEKCSE